LENWLQAERELTQSAGRHSRERELSEITHGR
jgi:hypothetical protein